MINGKGKEIEIKIKREEKGQHVNQKCLEQHQKKRKSKIAKIMHVCSSLISWFFYYSDTFRLLVISINTEHKKKVGMFSSEGVDQNAATVKTNKD